MVSKAEKESYGIASFLFFFFDRMSHRRYKVVKTKFVYHLKDELNISSVIISLYFKWKAMVQVLSGVFPQNFTIKYGWDFLPNKNPGSKPWTRIGLPSSLKMNEWIKTSNIGLCVRTRGKTLLQLLFATHSLTIIHIIQVLS